MKRELYMGEGICQVGVDLTQILLSISGLLLVFFW